MELGEAEKMTVEITRCTRCGGDHPIAFSKFLRPPHFDDRFWDWWGMCPNTKEPVLMYTFINGSRIQE